MKKVLLISVVLAFLSAPTPANAYTIGNVSVSETGGVTVSNEVEASGSSEADASVRSVIRTEGSNTRVRVDIQAHSDGVEYATSVSRTIRPGERMEARVATSSARVPLRVNASGVSGVSTTSVAALLPIFERFSSFIARALDLVFFFW